jgi:hypothetical protein
MDLIVESDIYVPSMDDKGNYIDKIPSFNNLKNGLRCSCGARKDKTYDCATYFASHTKSKTHQKWLTDMNTNKANFYTENVQLKETITNQKIIIARLEKEIIIKLKTIDYLTQQLISKETHNTVTNLLDFD